MNYSSSDCQEQSFLNEPMFKDSSVELVSMTEHTHFHPKTVTDFVANLRYLLDNVGMTKRDLATKSGISARYIDYLLSFEKYPTIEIAEKIGKAYGISGWQMIMPHLDYELAKGGTIDELIREYVESPKTTQDFVTDVLKRQSGTK
jgi:transcriptional regulator with XRE-family HTH domain